MQEKADDLIRWKTNAWQNPNMVQWYSERMIDIAGTSRLKNATEALLIEKSVSGNRVLDIGIGTGRGSLPLLRKGYTVTGIDSSQAMLDETRRLAGGLPIDLRVGDITALPCADAEYDSAISLNVLVHFPNWREAVTDWKRVVRPGGLIAFDIHSRENPIAAYGIDRRQWPQELLATENPSDFQLYQQRVSLQEVVDFARESDLSVRDVMPYATVSNANWLLRPLEIRSDWRRLLSWFASDDELLELGLFIEMFVVAHLSPSVTGRIFVVLVNERNEQRNDSVLARNATIESALVARDFARIEEFLPLRGAEFRKAFSRLLVPLRSRAFFFRIYESARLRGVDLGFLLDDEMRDWCDHAYHMGRRDEVLCEAFTRWQTAPQLSPAEADLASVLSYPMAPMMLGALGQVMGRKS
jgi:SAM-dependent methyltransferase